MIAATALAVGLPLYSGNPADFSGIDGLHVIHVPTPDRRERLSQRRRYWPRAERPPCRALGSLKSPFRGAESRDMLKKV